jgi:urea transport system ATP-binding protein
MLIGHQPKDFLLAVEGLTVSFDGFKAVNDLSFYIDDNEIRVIIGPNGAGKTTVLDLICGKTKATSGIVIFATRTSRDEEENQIVQAGVGRRVQTPSIYDDLTVFGISRSLFAWPHGVRRADLHARRHRARPRP